MKSSELDQAIAKAFASEGKEEDVNHAYLVFLRSVLYVPVEKTDEETAQKEKEEGILFKPLFANFEENYFMFAFDSLQRLHDWAGSEVEGMDYVELSGMDVVRGIHETVYLCVNGGTDFYKEFSPEEMQHLKKITLRLDQLRGGEKESNEE